MRRERLLNRIRLLERNPNARLEEGDTAERIRTIREYLQRILNTRQGNAPISEHFGLPDLTDLPSSMDGETVRELQQAMQRMVIRYEPRMEEIRVSVRRKEEDAGNLAFQITGKLSARDGSQPAVFEAEVEPGGQIRVSG